MPVFFVTGSDTGVGKTHVAGLLARRMARDGFTQVIKPVESGAAAGRPADALKAAGKWAEAHTLLTLPAPIAPLAAAKKARKQLDLATLLKLYRAVPSAPCRVVEGAGGVAVPIDPKGKDWSDFAAAIKPMAVIIVVEDRLGAINQARLAIAYLRRRYDGPMGVWLNAIKKPSPAVAAANRAGLADAWIPLYGESGPGKKPARFHFLPR
ncbi:MAG: dethiobiotin synthase [Opitutia bacterium Tous-C2FEB]|jgi:dethiobiotin synthetase|nr:MAG: dethiobiotin synthase [Opitutae bacterium Tous-C2FEB]PAZ03411.1 MAG: dethiobiotin synthase [Opitutae bacterium AMD-G3]